MLSSLPPITLTHITWGCKMALGTLTFIFVWVISCVSTNCEQRSDRDQCFATEILDNYSADPKHYEMLIESISDQRVQDYVQLELTRRINPHSRDRCTKIKSDALRKRCLTIVARPHLHRQKTN